MISSGKPQSNNRGNNSGMRHILAAAISQSGDRFYTWRSGSFAVFELAKTLAAKAKPFCYFLARKASRQQRGYLVPPLLPYDLLLFVVHDAHPIPGINPLSNIYFHKPLDTALAASASFAHTGAVPGTMRGRKWINH